MNPSSLAARLASVALSALVLVACGARGNDGKSPAVVALQLEHVWATQLSNDDVQWKTKGLEYGPALPLDNGLLAVCTREGRLVALDADTGESAWTFARSGPFVATPLVVGKRLVVGGIDGFLYAIDANTGALAWSFDTGAPIEAAASSDGNIVAVTNALNRVFVLEAEDGAFRWRKERQKVKDFTIFGQANPAVVGTTVFAGFSDGQIVAYDSADGAVIWGRDLSAGKSRYRDVDALSVADDKLFAASYAGGLYQLDTASGDVVWQRELEGVRSITPHRSTLYLNSVQGIHAVAASDGRDLWLKPLSDDSASGRPTLGEQYIYVGLQRTGLLLLDRLSGQTSSLFDLGSGFSAPASLSPGRLFVQSNRGWVYALAIDDSPLR